MDSSKSKNEARIFIVDDSEFSRATISEMLNDIDNINVVGEASSAEEASKLIPEKKPNIAIIDVVMPEVSGIELAKSLHKSMKDVAIVMISSLAQEHVVIDAISSGAVDFLQKPFTQEELISSIQKITETEVI